MSKQREMYDFIRFINVTLSSPSYFGTPVIIIIDHYIHGIHGIQIYILRISNEKCSDIDHDRIGWMFGSYHSLPLRVRIKAIF